jgi:hypothetical protein
MASQLHFLMVYRLRGEGKKKHFFHKKVRISLNIPGEFGIIRIAIEMADLAEFRTSRADAQVKYQ